MAMKRHNSAENESAPNRPYTRSQRAYFNESPFFSRTRCLAWFHKYSDDDDDVIGPEGMEQFCMDIGVDPEDKIMLVLAWKMNAYSMGFFTSSEWLFGLSDLKVDSVNKLRGQFDYLIRDFNHPKIFKQIYRFAFDFARDKKQRSLSIDIAMPMLNLLLGKKWKMFPSFAKFIEESAYNVVSNDQWNSILDFSECNYTNFTNYDENGSWPTMLDEFVEWSKNQKN